MTKMFSLNWIFSLANELNIIIQQKSKIPMGIAAEVWCITSNDGSEYIFKKSMFSTHKNKLILDQFHKAKDLSVLPNDFFSFSKEDVLYTVYKKIPGKVLEEFNQISLQKAYNSLCCLHKNNGFKSVPSIYADILEIAKEVLSNKKTKLLKDNKIIEKSATRILSELDTKKLTEMLNCRGILTHGDVKPNNIIMKYNKNVAFIDWEKICSVSPEFDISYCFLYSKDSRIDLSEHVNNYNFEIIRDCFNYIHDFHLLYDFYVFLKTDTRYDYVFKQVLPLYKNWEHNKTYYLEKIK